jgi:hypothetical protein
MSRGPCTFKQQDVTRALRAADAAGREVHRVEIDRNGKIVLVMAGSEPNEVEPKPPDSQIVL